MARSADAPDDGRAALGKLLAWVLRHRPDAIGIELDRAGWVEIDALLEGLRGYGRPLTRAELDACVTGDRKARYTLSPDGTRIRAAQGHSVPVDLELAPVEPPAALFHGTPRRFVASILTGGLDRGARHDVHLSPDPDAAVEVGERRGEAVILRVDAARMHRDGHALYRADNGVWLTRHVPARYLSTLESRAHSRQESAVPDALTLAAGSFELAALAWGPVDGAPVLASHGWLDNAATMARLAPLLVEALPLRIVSLDLPGHGLSAHERGHYHFVDYIADIVHAADALGWQRFSLLGHSMGAGISTLVAGTIPERIDRCVLLEGIGPMADDPTQAARRLARSLRVEARKHDKPKRVFASLDEAAARLREAAKMEVESARVLVERGLEPVDGGFVWRADPRLRIDSRLRFSEEAVHAFLTAIRCPTLVVIASDGWPRDEAVVRARLEAVADLERVTLEGHHHVHLDRPEAVAAALIPFLSPLVEAGKP